MFSSETGFVVSHVALAPCCAPITFPLRARVVPPPLRTCKLCVAAVIPAKVRVTTMIGANDEAHAAMGVEAMTDIGKAMEVKELKAVRSCRSAGSLGSTLCGYEISRAETDLKRAWEQDQATHAENEPAIFNNATVREKIIKLMTAAGVPDHFYAPKPGSRAYIPKKVKHTAGYLGDLARTFPVGDGFDAVKRLYESQMQAIEEHKKRAAAAQQAAGAESERALKRRQADIKLATIIVRYELPETTDWGAALLALRARDKYLDLAIAGYQTRGDWSEGFYRVEDALGRFHIEDDQDKRIAANLCGCLARASDGEGDGRIFRDTQWSYDKLFDLVADKTLLADARVCLENV